MPTGMVSICDVSIDKFMSLTSALYMKTFHLQTSVIDLLNFMNSKNNDAQEYILKVWKQILPCFENSILN